MATAFVLDSSVLKNRLREIAKRTRDLTPVLKAWAVETGRDIEVSWNKMSFGSLYNGSKSFRNGAAAWRRVNEQYRRKSGARVPPWGDSRAKGRKRPSGARVHAGDIVGKDTRTMARQFTREAKMHASKRSISLVSNTSYAVYQNRLRQFNKTIDKDKKTLGRIYVNYLNAALKAADAQAKRGARP